MYLDHRHYKKSEHYTRIYPNSYKLWIPDMTQKKKYELKKLFPDPVPDKHYRESQGSEHECRIRPCRAGCKSRSRCGSFTGSHDSTDAEVVGGGICDSIVVF